MPRTKGSKNKPKPMVSTNVFGALVKQLQVAGISADDLSSHYKKGAAFTESDLAHLFAKHRPALEKMQIKIARGRTAGSMRPLKEEEILSKFAERVAIEMNKVSPSSSIFDRVTQQAKDKPLKF